MTRNSATGVNFVRRTYPPRIFGMVLAFPAGAVILYQHQAPWHFWLFAIFGGLLWPHLAYFIASRSKNPTLAEYRNLVMDSVFAGLSVPLLSFNLLPSLVMLTMASLGNITVGGWRTSGKSWRKSVVPTVSHSSIIAVIGRSRFILNTNATSAVAHRCR